MEASESMIPLIIITTDRPYELQDCSENQATNQRGIFSNFTAVEKHFPAVDSEEMLSSMQSLLNFTLNKSKLHKMYPLHLNIAFREPTFDDQQYQFDICVKRQFFTHEPLQKACNQEIIQLLNESKNTLIIVGEGAIHQSGIADINLLSKKLASPVFCDALSGHLTNGFINHLLSHGASIFKHKDLLKDLKPDLILHLGGRITSKGGKTLSKDLYSYLFQNHSAKYLHVYPHKKMIDPNHQVTHFLQEEPSKFCALYHKQLRQKEHSEFLNRFLELNSIVKQAINLFLESQKDLTEPLFFHKLSNCNLSGHELFIGNSMPIRDLREYYHPKTPLAGIYGNRGLSGIDGNLSTAIGIALATQKPTLCVVGDLTFLHDLTALFSIKNVKAPMTFIALNNNGGSIFHALPISKKEKVFEKYFETPQDVTLENAGSLFGIEHYTLCSYNSFDELENLILRPHHKIIEVPLCSKRSFALRASLKTSIENEICCLC